MHNVKYTTAYWRQIYYLNVKVSGQNLYMDKTWTSQNILDKTRTLTKGVHCLPTNWTKGVLGQSTSGQNMYL